jgi:hypothetical protein
MNGIQASTPQRPLSGRASKTPVSGVNLLIRFAFWALAVLVVACLALVTWFWTVMLSPSHRFDSGHTSNCQRDSFYAHFEAPAQPLQERPATRGQ